MESLCLFGRMPEFGGTGCHPVVVDGRFVLNIVPAGFYFDPLFCNHEEIAKGATHERVAIAAVFRFFLFFLVAFRHRAVARRFCIKGFQHRLKYQERHGQYEQEGDDFHSVNLRWFIQFCNNWYAN